MSEMSNHKSFWTTLPGILLGIAAIITAIVGTGGILFLINPTPTPTPTQAIPRVAQNATATAEAEELERQRTKEAERATATAEAIEIEIELRRGIETATAEAEELERQRTKEAERATAMAKTREAEETATAIAKATRALVKKVDGVFKPDLAEWDNNPDLTSYTFFLDEFVKMQNGDGLYADDVERAVVNSDLLTDLGVEEIEKIDDFTIRFHLSNPRTPDNFLEIISKVTFMTLPGD